MLIPLSRQFSGGTGQRSPGKPLTGQIALLYVHIQLLLTAHTVDLFWLPLKQWNSLDVTHMGKIPFHFICAFWCVLLELSLEKDRNPKTQGLCSDAIALFFLEALVSIGDQTNMTKGLRY